YAVKVSNSAGSVTSAAATLTVNAAVVAPAITMQPMNQTVTAGANVSFSVTATGTAPLSYQWTKNGTAITGATSASLALASVTTADAGSYAVKVSNSAGSVTSTAATLTVNAAVVAPAIAMQPASQTVTAGANVSFSVMATGTAPLSYQWTKNGANITGATSATLALASVTTADAGSYAVKVSNSAGSVTSTAATLTVNAATVAPTITMQPGSRTVVAGASVSFSVMASGTAPLSYQWSKDGTAIAGATSATLTLNNVTTANQGSYAVKVSNSAGSVTSTAATLTVNPVPVALSIALTSPTNGASFVAPAEVPVAVTVSPASTVGTVGFFDGTNLLGTVSAAPYTLTLSNVLAGEHILTAVVRDNAGATATSDPVTITVANSTPSSNAAPVVKLLLPKDGTTLAAPARVMLVAQATDTNGSIAKVEFFNGTTRLGAGVPFKADDDDRESNATQQGTLYFLVVERLPAGHYVLTAKATDNQGAVTVSAPVRLTIKWTTHRVPRRDD
ncbi:MAG TPA: immunoglobulin domain-containing protein, partial [Candidatus Sulfotelmatobacter sp.]|nr:immunoglobulin domain-containing protein [Candidatus Sulfotelmatobacter sp.]